MNETKELPPPDEPAPLVERPRQRRDFMPVVNLVGFLILAAAIILLWERQSAPQEASVDPAAFAALSQETANLSQRLAKLEQRAAAPPTDLHPLESRMSALEQRPLPSPPPPPPDLQPLEDRIAAAEQKIVAVEQTIPKDSPSRADIVNLSTRLDAVATRQDQLAARQQGLETSFANRLDRVNDQVGTLQQQALPLLKLPDQVQGMDQRLGTTEKQAGQVASVADRAARIARIQAAQSALEAGQPLGQIPNAPAALTRFADAKPPTEAELRLAFPAAARAAEEASIPSTEGQPLLDRLWTRAQMLVTLREGDQVIVGDPAAGVIARAKQALAAGDLRGAVNALDALNGPAASAIAPWKARAQSLLDARAALATLAAAA